MLADPATDGIGTDQEHPATAGKRVGQRSRVVEVAVADVRATRAQLAQGLWPASDEDEVLGREALEQSFGDEAAEVARRSCDDDAHGIFDRQNATFLAKHATDPGGAREPIRRDGSTVREAS